MATNVFEKMIANIERDPQAWCKDEWCDITLEGKPVSRCLVEHLDLAVGTVYVKPDGRVFWSKSVARWKKRQRFAAHLLYAIEERYGADAVYGYERDDAAMSEQANQTASALARNAEVEIRAGGKNWDRYSHYRSEGWANWLVSWNDDSQTSRRDVLAALRTAAERFPRDTV